MKNLIPHFIQQNVLRNKSAGKFQAASLFVDISGFTNLTETLMKHSKRGAEVLTNILNSIFNPIVNNVYIHGGMISTFAGDAFTALFPVRCKDAHLHAVQVAFFINRFFEENGTVHTQYGDFEIGVKVGISIGEVKWGILGQDAELTYYFRGEAIDSCAQAEHVAEKGDIIADRRIIPLIQSSVEATPVKIHHKLLSSTLDLPAKRSRKFKQDITILKRFVAESVIELGERAEFRDVCSVFISFAEPENVEILNYSVTSILKLVHQYQGYFNKIDFGDKGGVMLILFGAPIAFENNIERALNFVLTLKKIESIKIQWRAGLTYGRVYTGNVGGKERSEYTAIGDIVNLSARFMMRAKWGQLLLNERIYNESRHKYEMIHSGAFAYKGLSKPIRTYELISRKAVIESFFSGQMIGRNLEFTQLQKHIKSIFDNKFGGVVYIDGIAGIGKSRLLSEVQKELIRYRDQARLHFKWFHMPCDKILRKSFNPIIYFLKEYFTQLEQNSNTQNKALFEEKLQYLVSELRNLEFSSNTDITEILIELKRTKSILGHLVNLYWEDSLYENLDARGRYENTLYAFKNLVRAESLIQPVIIELEDGHWVDADTIKLLQTLTRDVRHDSFIIVTTCRYLDDGSEFQFKFPSVIEHRIKLQHLDKTASHSMIVENLLTHHDVHDLELPESTFEFIFEKSEGNPFYIEQIVLYLQENQLFDSDLNLISKAFDIPAGINSIIIARIDRLSQKVKDVIKAASVIGLEFEIRILSAVLREDVQLQIKVGEEGKIWSEISELQYIFKHALLKDAVYEMQMEEQLKKLHQLTAEAIETLYEERKDDFAADLARHWELAHQFQKAKDAYLIAARNTMRNYAHEESERLFNKYFSFVDKLDYESLVARDEFVREILKLHGRFDEVIPLVEENINNADFINAESLKVRFINTLGIIYANTGRIDDAQKCFEQVLETARKIGAAEVEANAVGYLGTVHAIKGNSKQAVEFFEEAIELFGQQNDILGLGCAYANYASFNGVTAKYEKSMELYKKALQIMQQEGDREHEASILGNMAVISQYLGAGLERIDYYKQALAIQKEIGDVYGESISLNRIARIHEDNGEYDQAENLFRKALENQRKMGNREAEGETYRNLGGLMREKKQTEASRKFLEKALLIAKEVKHREHEAAVYVTLGELYNDIDETNQSLEYFRKSLEIRRELGNVRQTIQTLRQLAEHYLKLGDFEQAFNYNNQSLEMAKNSDHTFEQIRTLVSLAVMERQVNNDLKKTAQHLEEGQKLLKVQPETKCVLLLAYQRGYLALARNQSAERNLQEFKEKYAELKDQLTCHQQKSFSEMIERLQLTQEAFDSGETGRMFRGELIEWLPETISRRKNSNV